MDDDALVNDIDAEIAPPEAAAVINQFARIGDYRFVSFGSKILLQDEKLAFSGHAFPVHDGDLRTLCFSAPFAIGIHQRPQQSGDAVPAANAPVQPAALSR